MTIYDFADAIGVNLVIIRHPNQDGPTEFSCSFERSETKDSPTNAGATVISGWGSSPKNATLNYALQISGKFLIVGGLASRDRTEFHVPKNLTE